MLDLKNWRTPLIVIIAGCAISTTGFGIRSAFGLFLEPMTVSMNWDRETFALAMALQNLMWGIGLPFAGAIADKFGTVKVIIAGALVYSIGVWGMSVADTGVALYITGGILTGLGIAFSAFTLALTAMVRVVGEQKRSFVLGVGTAAGSFGQVLFSPLSQGFITAFGWNTALVILASITLLMIPMAICLPTSGATQEPHIHDQSLSEAIYEACHHRGYILLTSGFFVCGFHIAFITIHLPSYIKDLGLDPAIGAYALTLIGMMNIIGSILSGVAGQKWSKKYGLSVIYFARAMTITALLLLPKTPLVMLLFAGTMGILWLSTIPLTTGIVVQVFGLRYMGTLFGIVFLSHQIGSFMGAWLGGRIYDQTGSYDGMWWAGVVVGVLAAVIHLPINEQPLSRHSTVGHATKA